jgi:hypothetical protein
MKITRKFHIFGLKLDVHTPTPRPVLSRTARYWCGGRRYDCGSTVAEGAPPIASTPPFSQLRPLAGGCFAASSTCLLSAVRCLPWPAHAHGPHASPGCRLPSSIGFTFCFLLYLIQLHLVILPVKLTASLLAFIVRIRLLDDAQYSGEREPEPDHHVIGRISSRRTPPID